MGKMIAILVLHMIIFFRRSGVPLICIPKIGSTVGEIGIFLCKFDFFVIFILLLLLLLLVVVVVVVLLLLLLLL